MAELNEATSQQALDDAATLITLRTFRTRRSGRSCPCGIGNCPPGKPDAVCKEGGMNTTTLSFDTSKLRACRMDKITLPECVRLPGVMLAGGALRTIIDRNDEVCDFDLFFKTELALSNCRTVLAAIGTLIFECPEGRLFTYKVGDQKYSASSMVILKVVSTLSRFSISTLVAQHSISSMD